MTFLELVAELHRESGAGSTAPTTTANQKGEALRLVNWIKQANLIVQNLFIDWKFRWATGTLTLDQGTFIYSYPAGAVDFDRSAFFLDGEPLNAQNYIDVKQYMRETAQGQPFQVVLMPNATLRFDNTPDKAYTVNYDYYVEALDFDSLTENEPNTTLIPDRYHSVIIGLALTYYAKYENAPEIMEQGKGKLEEWMPRLQSNQLAGTRYQSDTAEGGDLVIEIE